MKTKHLISNVMVSFLMILFSFTAGNGMAQAKADSMKMKDCCMMKDGKMMCVKEGKMMPMDKDMKMKNGTTCMMNGDCVMKDGKKMKMKNGECMDMDGKMDTCGDHMNHKGKMMHAYACPMHPEVTSKNAGKCSKCGMDLKETKEKTN